MVFKDGLGFIIIFLFILILFIAVGLSALYNMDCIEETGFVCDSKEYECKLFCEPNDYYFNYGWFGINQCLCKGDLSE